MTNDEKTNEAPNGPSDSKAMLEGKLTPEQVENWRNVLLDMIGPYALIMPVEQVQAMRDKFHARNVRAARSTSTLKSKTMMHGSYS